MHLVSTRQHALVVTGVFPLSATRQHVYEKNQVWSKLPWEAFDQTNLQLGKGGGRATQHTLAIDRLEKKA